MGKAFRADKIIADRILLKKPKGRKYLNSIGTDGMIIIKFLFLSFRRVLNVNYSFLGNSPA